MPKRDNQPPPGEMAQAKLREYYTVVPKPPKEKNQEKVVEIEEEIEFFDVTNDSNDKNDNIITTHNTQTEKATTKETNTAPTNIIQQDKDEEEVDSIDGESREE